MLFFFFHPSTPTYSAEVQVASVVVNLALMVITAGVYLLVFAGMHANEVCQTPTNDASKSRAMETPCLTHIAS